MTYTPSQIDEANLKYHYTKEDHPTGVYYRLKSGNTSFPAGFWESERASASQSPPLASQSPPLASSSHTSHSKYFQYLSSVAAGNKKRLYVALYPSGVVNNEERRYHWAFLIGPKSEKNADTPGVRYHVKNLPISGWTYEEKDVSDVQATNTLLARILIAKVENEQRLIELLRNIPIVNNDPNWRCRTWIAQALAKIEEDGNCVGSSRLKWEVVEAFARQYVAQKTTAGRYQRAEDMLGPKPTYDLIEGKEIVR